MTRALAAALGSLSRPRSICYLEDDVWLGWKRLMLTYYSRPGFQSWWAVRQNDYSNSFIRFLETEKLDKPVASYFDITQLKSGTPSSD